MQIDIICYPMCADADAGIYSRTVPEYHARPRAKRKALVHFAKSSQIRNPTASSISGTWAWNCREHVCLMTKFSVRQPSLWRQLIGQYRYCTWNFHKSNISSNEIRCVEGTPTFVVTPSNIQYIDPSHHGHTKVNVMGIEEQLTPLETMQISPPIPGIRLFQTLTIKTQCQDHGCGQREGSHSWPSVKLICLLLVSHQSNKRYLR